MYPYNTAEQMKLEDAMQNDRSLEEWDRLANKPYTMEEVEYTDDGSEAEHCSICDHYVNATTCAIVNGVINAGGWCNKFTQYETRSEVESYGTD